MCVPTMTLCGIVLWLITISAPQSYFFPDSETKFHTQIKQQLKLEFYVLYSLTL
jgi:hypothetical protein